MARSNRDMQPRVKLVTRDTLLDLARRAKSNKFEHCLSHQLIEEMTPCCHALVVVDIKNAVVVTEAWIKRRDGQPQQPVPFDIALTDFREIAEVDENGKPLPLKIYKTEKPLKRIVCGDIMFEFWRFDESAFDKWAYAIAPVLLEHQIRHVNICRVFERGRKDRLFTLYMRKLEAEDANIVSCRESDSIDDVVRRCADALRSNI